MSQPDCQVSAIRFMEPRNRETLEIYEALAYKEVKPKARLRVSLQPCPNTSPPSSWRINVDWQYNETHPVSSATIESVQIELSYGHHFAIVEFLDDNNHTVGSGDSIHFDIHTPVWYQELVKGPSIGEVQRAVLTVDGRTGQYLPEAALNRFAQIVLKSQSEGRALVPFEADLCDIIGGAKPTPLSIGITYKLRNFQHGVVDPDPRANYVHFPALRGSHKTWLPLRDGCRIATTPAPSVAVLLHLTHVQVWVHELRSRILYNGLGDSTLYVNVVNQDDETSNRHIERLIKRDMPSATVLFSPQHGGFMGGYMRLWAHIVRTSALHHHDLFLCLHSDPDPWLLREILSPLLSSPLRVAQILHIFATRPDVGMIGSLRLNLPSTSTDYTSQTPGLGLLQSTSSIGLSDHVNATYADGGMFWIRLTPLLNLFTAVDPAKFVAEIDASSPLSFPDAIVERLVAYSVHKSNMTLLNM